MAIAYSYDLRIRTIKLISSGKKVTEVAKTLNIARSTLHVWLYKTRNGLDLKPKAYWQKGHSHKIIDLVKFKNFVDKNSDLTLDELAAAWKTAARSTINRALKKIGYTKKKDLWVLGKK